MKRKTHSEKPVWQDQPMGEIVILIDGWELLKKGHEVIGCFPEEIAAFQKWRDGLAPDARMYVGWLDSIIPAAKAEIAAWLKSESPGAAGDATEATVPTVSRVPATVFLVIVRLWERFLAAGELGDREDQTRWLAEKSREEQLLLTRLGKRIVLANS